MFKKLGAVTQLKQVEAGGMKQIFSRNVKFQLPTYFKKENIATVDIFVIFFNYFLFFTVNNPSNQIWSKKFEKKRSYRNHIMLHIIFNKIL